MKIVLGVTGSFGTGKTFVSSAFKSLGARVLDADKIARGVLVKKRMEVHDIFGAVGRKTLARIVFGDKNALARLNRIIHPDVIRIIKKEISRNRIGVIVIDAPLLVEANLTNLVDYTVVVKASGEKQVKRCIKKFGMSRSEVLRRVRSQIPISKKIRLADFVVDNNGTKSDTKKRVKEIWRKIWR